MIEFFFLLLRCETYTEYVSWSWETYFNNLTNELDCIGIFMFCNNIRSIMMKFCIHFSFLFFDDEHALKQLQDLGFT